MKDSDLIVLFAGILESAVAAEGLTGIPVAQLFQPTQQSLNSAGTGVYFQLLFTRRHGSPYKTQSYNATTMAFDHKEFQQLVATFQISVFYPADPTDEDRISSNDLAEQLCMRMQSDATIRALRAQNVGVMRITDVRNPSFDNDQDQSEFVPSFDLQLNYIREIDDTVPRIVEIIGDVKVIR